MARPKKPVNYDEELMKIDAQITKWTHTIEELEEERQLLLQQREQEELSKFYGFCKENGLSMEQAISIVQSHAKVTQQASA